jgi:ferric-dicitrate binding protein FerR (iron transport regulator)
MIDRRHLLLALGSASTVGLDITSVMAQTAAAGTIADMQGNATARRGNEQRTLGMGQQVYVSERLQTAANSKLQAQLGPATKLFMGENTRVMIDNHLVRRGGAIHLGQGAVLFERSAPDPKPAVTIRSPYALLAVRGTTVFAGPSNGVFGVFVVTGEVEVRNGAGSVRLGPGQGTDIARPGAKPSSAAVWGDARINAAMRSVR